MYAESKKKPEQTASNGSTQLKSEETVSPSLTPTLKSESIEYIFFQNLKK